MPHFDKEDVLAAMTGRYASFYEQFTPLKPFAGELRGPCPLHGGQGPNFAVSPETGLWHCFTQCQGGGDVLEFLMRKEGLDFPEALAAAAEWSGLPAGLGSAPRQSSPRQSSTTYQNGSSPPQSPRRITQVYDYTDEAGGLLFQAVRYEPKGFSQRRPAETGRAAGAGGAWIYSIEGVRRVLYRLPEVLAAIAAGKPVYFCEGEKDADALAALGLAATTAPMGAMKKPEQWDAGYTEALRGASVVILPDNDPAGRGHAGIVAAALSGAAKRVRIVSLPGLPNKGDVSDWLDAGGTPERLFQLAKETLDWVPGREALAPANKDAPARTITAIESIPPPASAAWPEAAAAMFYGLAGDFVRLVEPHTEADPVAVLVQFLLAFGSASGRHAHFVAEADKHFSNMNAVLVGVSSKGRKGTSWGQVRRLFENAAPDWSASCLQSGLSSGEGLIHAVRDPTEKQVKNKKTGEMETVVEDAGAEDKRLLVQESEFASVLRVAGRDGNTLSAILRDAWDKGTLQTMTKNNAARATGAHVSLIGHITADELRRELTSTEAGNGFANRFLWVMVRRSKELPEGGNLQPHELNPLTCRLQQAINAAESRQEMRRDDGARSVWLSVYSALSAGGPGLLGVVTSRGEAQVMRLALLYALLDEDDAIRRPHMEAALALWDYCEESAKYVFGDSLGDAIADTILRGLSGAKNGLTRTEIAERFSRHESGGRIDAALGLLHTAGRILGQKETTGGRPIERWFIA